MMRLNSKGFTLVELMTVFAILSILIMIAMPNFISARDDSAKNVCQANRAMIAKAYQLALVKDSSITLQSFIDNPENYGDYYASKPVCPLGGTYTSVNGKIVCSHEGHDDDVAAGNGTTVGVTTSNNLILTIKALEGITKKINSGIQLNGELKEALGGSFLPVEDYIIEMVFGDAYNGGVLTWRTDSVSKTKIYFAANGNKDWGEWKAYLVVVDGVLYKTNLTNSDGSLKAANVAQLNSLTGDELAARLASDFEVVGAIEY